MSGRSHGLDVSALVEQYLADLRTRARPRTIANTEAILGRLLPRMGLVDVSDVTKAKAQAWRHARLADGVSHKTVNTEIGCLLAALNLAVSLDQIAANPLKGLKALPVHEEHRRREARALTEAEIGLLLAAATRLDLDGGRPIPREPLLRALIGTGARWTELISTTWGDFDPGQRTLSFRGKTSKSRKTSQIPLDPDVQAGIETMRRAAAALFGRIPAPHERIFLSPRGKPLTRETSNFHRWLAGALERAGIQRVDHEGRIVHVHAFRHTFCSRLARFKVPLKVAQSLSRHKTVQVLLNIYQHVTTDEAHAAIQGLPRLPIRRSLSRADEGSAPDSSPARQLEG